MITIAWTLCTGGIYLSEHPAPPSHPEAASIWHTPWMRLLTTHPDVFLHVVAQWRWGCTVSKPTGLLAVGIPKFRASMYSRQDPAAQAPTEVAIGLGQNGQFRTAAHKEYPPHFCNALAGTVIDQIWTLSRQHKCRMCPAPDPGLSEWLQDAAHFCGILRTDASWLPDYQGT